MTPKTRTELIIEVWEALDCESVGEMELRQIQEAVAEHFGDRAVVSPAATARILADEGAVLRHPEVLEFDTKWRESELSGLADLQFITIVAAIESMSKLDDARRELGRDGRERLVSAMALKLKTRAKTLARSDLLNKDERAIAGEVAQWLTIWLSGPELFPEWLSLRQRSADFIEKFGK